MTGTRERRPELDRLLEQVRPGDTVELYVEAPTSVGLLYAVSAGSGRTETVATIEAAHEAAIGA